MIYLDHNATSPVLPEVREAMLRWLGVPANPSSAHQAGQAAAMAVDVAREQVAALVGGKPAGVVFTSGATEANHLFLRGAMQRQPGRLVVGPMEHPCVKGAAKALHGQGQPVTVLQADPQGRTVLPEALPEGATVVSLMAANHETGVVQPFAELAAMARTAGAAMHVDATQFLGRLPWPEGLRVDGVAMSGHKLGGPPGIGALMLPDGEPFPPLYEGSQERGRRGGTVPTALAVGLGVACELALSQLQVRRQRWVRLREEIEAGIHRLGGRVIGAEVARVPQTTCAVFEGVRGESLVQALDLRGVCVSAGSACTSGSMKASEVLQAMGDPQPDGVLRVSLGPDSTRDDVQALLAALPDVLSAIRLASEWEW